MIWILENSDSERAVISNYAGFNKLLHLGIDVRLNRFKEGSRIVCELPVVMRNAGAAKALRQVADAVGAIYPADINQLAVVSDDGRVLAGPGDKIDLARMTGTARRTVWRSLSRQEPLTGWGWVVCVK